MDLQNEIIRITSEYLKNNIDYFELSKISKEYKTILNKIAGEDMNVQNGREDIHFDNGKALGTFWAALCLDDILRTRQFIRGIDKAIKEKKSSQSQLHILYAGTGPFATLILPFVLMYPKEEIKYTFLEINPLSFKMLKNTISKLGLEAYDITFVEEDATKYKIDPKNEPGIIISETMQNALAKEQQVPIFLNLMSQVTRDTVFIPEKIELFLGLKEKGVPQEQLQKKHYFKESKVFELSKESMFSSSRSERNITKEVAFEKVQTVIEKEKLEKYNQIVIITDIQVFGDENIDINESSLTTPVFIKDIPDDLKGSMIIDTQYKISSEPKLEYKITSH